MINKKKIKLFSFLSLSSLMVVTSLITINSETKNQNEINYSNNINNNIPEIHIASPTSYTINQQYQINQFNFNSSLTTGEFNLLDRNKNINLNNQTILPFARTLNSNGNLNDNSFMDHTLELDLNIWKPLGMDEDYFLQNITFDISNGYIKSRQDYKLESRLMNYNISSNNFVKDKVPNNFDNLAIEKETIIGDSNPPLPEKKLIFNVLNKDDVNDYLSPDKSYCFIILEVIHQKSKEEQGKPNINGINRLLITPKIAYSWVNNPTTDPNYEKYTSFIIPSQKITLTLKSDLFKYSEASRILNDSYISDNQRFSLYEKDVEADNNNQNVSNSGSNLKNYLTLDTSLGNNEITLSPKSIDGSKVPMLNIDTSNFYFSQDYNQLKNKNFLVSIEGIEIRMGTIFKDKNTSFNFFKEYKSSNNNDNQNNEKPDTLNLSFEINDNEFNNQNKDYEKIESFDLFNQTMIDGFNELGNNNAGVKLEIRIKPLYDKNNQRIPFHYQISSFRFIGKSAINYDQNSNPFKLDVCLEIDSSNEVIVKTKPLDFSYTKMNQQLLNSQKELMEFTSNYSSNVFDDTYFLDEQNQKVQTNYKRVHQHLKTKFEQLLNQNIDFRNSLISLDLLNNPFSQIQYTSAWSEFRTKGTMSLKYAPKFKNKYFKYLDISQRAMINVDSNQKEIVEIKFNQTKLNEFAKNVKTMDILIQKLNELSDFEIRSLLDITCPDIDINNPKNNIIDFNSVVFSKIGNTNNIQVKFNLTDKFHILMNEKLIQKNVIIQSDYIKIETFNPDKITLTIKENEVGKLASNYENYSDLKTHFNNPDEIKKLVDVSINGSIEMIEFIDTPGFNNKISIKVVLFDGYVFHNDTREQIVSVANINWKGQNNKTKALKLDLNFKSLAKKLQIFNSVEDFISKNQNPNLNSWMGIFIFGTPINGDGKPTTVNDLYSIKFESISSSLRKIKVIVQAKEWRYFEYPGSSQKDDTIEFIISNITWNGETENSLVGLNINVDMPYLYQLLVKYYKENPQTSLDSFINENRKNFLIYGKNDVSIIKINPYDEMAINPAIIVVTKTGISISFEINEGFYWNKNDDFENDRFISTFNSFISIDDIKKYHQEFIKPNPENAVNNIEIKVNKLANDVKNFANINQFINSIKSDFDISEYLNFYIINDIKKVNTFSINKIDSHSLEIKITIFDQYYFLDEDSSMKTKTFVVHNLIFKNEETKLIAISTGIDRTKTANKAREFNSRDEMVEFYKDKNSVEEYKEFIVISQKYIEAIESIKIIKGSTLNSIQFVIKLKNGYYFKGKNPIIAEGKINISNLLFKKDPLLEEILIATKISIKGNDFANKAKEFESFELFKQWLLGNNNWKSLLNISFNKENINNQNVILRFDIFPKSNHKFIISITLNDGYYFDNENFTINSKEFIVGNIYFKNDEVVKLNDIDIKFNSERFYKITKDLEDKSWDGFLNLISPNVLNFNDPYNAILWTNANEQKVFNVINISLSDNNLKIELELIDGYYFDNNDKTNVALNLTYSSKELERLFNKGRDDIESETFKRNLIIGLSVAIPFAIVFIVIIFWIIRTKMKNKNSDLKGDI